MDKPVTDAELDQFYGSEASQDEVDVAIARHVKALDAEDIGIIACDNADYILNAIRGNEGLSVVGYVLQQNAKKLIADRVSIELFGRHGYVKSDEVKL